MIDPCTVLTTGRRRFTPAAVPLPIDAEIMPLRVASAAGSAA
jgi:hypothetical protein